MIEPENNLHELPNSWVWTRLGEIIDIRNGFAFKSRDYRDGGILLIRQSNLGRSKVDFSKAMYLPDAFLTKYQEFIVRKGDILIGMSGSIGKLCVYNLDTPALQNQRTGLIQFFEPETKQYVRYYFDTLESHLTTMAKGVAVQNISASQIESCPLPLPPLPEQHRIVAKIEELFTKLDAGVEALKKVKAQLKRYRQSVLKYAFEGKLTEEWREKHKGQLEPASVLLERIREERKKTAKGKYKKLPPLDASGLPELPKGWMWTTLPQIGELNRGKSKHRPRNDPKLYGGPYPFIQTGDVGDANGVLRQYSQTYNEAGLRQSHLWPKGTLCITIAANIAETAILGFDACFPDSIVGFLPDPSHCDVRFIEYFIRTAKENIESYAPATAQKNINLEILSKIAVPFAPLEEQRQLVSEIERRFSLADEVERTVYKSLKQAQRLRQSILKKVFEGKLVPQDPSDEPASVLLERIKAEKVKREAEEKKKNKHKTKVNLKQLRLI